MIKKLTLHNFKAFQNTGQLDIKPMTILAGANSSGKSSILQSLLLLKQTVEIDPIHSNLNLDGRYVQVSGIDELTFNKPSRTECEIGFDFELQGSGFVGKRFLERHFPRFKIQEGRRYRLQGDISIRFRYHKFGEEKYKVGVNRFEIRTRIDDTEGPKLTINYWGGRYRFDFKGSGLTNPKPGEGKEIIDLFLIHFVPYQYIVKTKGEKRAEFVKFDDVFEIITRALMRELQNLRFLGPLREIPRRAYLHSGTTFPEIGQRGEYAAQILWLERNTKIEYIKKLGQKAKTMNLLEAVGEVFKDMGIIQPIDVSSSKRIVYQILFGIQSSNTKKSVTIADVGFGISQLLPIIVMGLTAPRDSLLLYEQPEIHLHPRLQANLADFLLRLSAQGKRIMVETHSEHFIHRIRRRIVEDDSDRIMKDVNILFTHQPSKKRAAKIEALKVDRYGIIENWPEDFFPESADEAASILRKGIEKRSIKK